VCLSLLPETSHFMLTSFLNCRRYVLVRTQTVTQAKINSYRRVQFDQVFGRTRRTRSSRPQSPSMARTNGPEYPPSLFAKHQSNAKRGGTNGSIPLSRRQNGQRSALAHLTLPHNLHSCRLKTRNCCTLRSSCLPSGELLPQ